MIIDLKILACLALCVVMVQGRHLDLSDITRELLMEALFERDYYGKVPNQTKKDYEGKGKVPYIIKKDYEGKGKVPYIIKKDYEGKGKVPYIMKKDYEGKGKVPYIIKKDYEGKGKVPYIMKKDYEGKGKVPYIIKKDYEGKGKVPYIMKKDYEGKGKVPYIMKRDPEGATLERGKTQALADFERETSWSNKNGETSQKTLLHHIKDFVGGDCGELFKNTYYGLVGKKKEDQYTDTDLATGVSRKRAKEEETDAKILLDALTVAAADAHDCLLGQQDAFVGDGRETVDDVATTDTPVFSRKATLQGDWN
ncbi:uncharacterized protein LOC132752413 [Ruditapes philippinarum]|uniref:uncharacterized protein LOC132752413 n=1 Tax=Ruditapes philippinarum TaxID=129788 RepID=UPI00295B87A8|nr:uncharacterized protein LOC132752413 [Ruditapes philippinarum]XP_060598717.1 uncharacterized protein LOC132752413 [Ruditapes philippinarum]